MDILADGTPAALNAGNPRRSAAALYGTLKRLTADQPDRMRAYLDALQQHGTYASAAYEVGCDLESARLLRHNDKQFGEACDAAREFHRQVYRDEMKRRAVDGVDEPVFQNGRQAVDAEGNPAFKRVYSDSLLLAMAKRFDPDFIERKQLEVAGKVEHMHTLTIDLANLSPEKMAAYRILVGLEAGSGIQHLITGDAPKMIEGESADGPAAIDAEFEEVEVP